MPNDETQFNLRIGPQTRREIEELAAEWEVSMSEAVRVSVRLACEHVARDMRGDVVEARP